MKVLLVFGTRPEAIKMAPLALEFFKYRSRIETRICVTGQHREMLDQVLNLFEIVPDFDLDIMEKGQDLYDVTSKVLVGLRHILHEEKPDLVIVHGDTASSTAAALASFYQHIPVAHVEAGLRTYNIYSPWPEEVNRQLTSRIASFHFAPTLLSKTNLLNEKIDEKNIIITGNTVIDALLWVVENYTSNLNIESKIRKSIIISFFSDSILQKWKNGERRLVLITGHRRENFGIGFINICQSIKDLALKNPEVDFVYPMHLNPNVRGAIYKTFGKLGELKKAIGENSNLYFIEPLEYLQFVYMMNLSYLVLTDSGGIQEEAPSLGKPVLVMRNNTERPEALTAGTVRLVGTDKNFIINEVQKLLLDRREYEKMASTKNPYGDGSASKIIVEWVLKEYNL